MRLFFWDFNDVNDIQREWALFVTNLLAVLFTTYCLIKTAKFHGKVVFELLPLSINTIATIVLLFIKLFEKGYQFDLVAFVIQIFTYFLFCYTFSLLHAQILQKQSRKVKKLCNGLLLFLAFASIVVIILVMATVIERNCDNNLIEGSLACFATELLSYIPTAYFGIDLLRNIDKKNKKQRQIDSQGSSEVGVFDHISDRYIKQRRKQIKLVLIAYTVSLVLRGIILIFNFNFDSYFTCVECQNIHILTSDQPMGQFLLVLIQINQLIPHLIIPIALFVIPNGRKRINRKITLEDTLIEEEEQEDKQTGDIIQRRISRSIVSNRASVLNDNPDQFGKESPRKLDMSISDS